MKKTMSWILGVAVLAALGSGVARAQKHHHHKGETAMCPMMIEGAQVQVSNVEQGVTIHITAEDPASIKKIQAAAAEHAAGKKEGCSCCKHKAASAAPAPQAGPEKTKEAVYVCPMGMGCYQGPNTKDGRCPKCGMDLRKQ